MHLNLRNVLYAPTLKWKEGEYKGLGELPTSLKDRILPIFLMPPPGSYDNEEQKILTPDEHIKSFGARLSAHWGGRLCFVDAGQVDNADYKVAAEGAHPLLALFERSKLSQPRGIVAPATALDRSREYQSAASKILKNNPELPLCLRLRPEDLDGSDIVILISDLLNQLDVKPDRVVLVLDASELADWSDPDGLGELLADLINRLPYLSKWKLLVSAMCSLPADSAPPPRATTRYTRNDWNVYSVLASKALDGSLLRQPIYSDYGTESASFKPGGGVYPATQIRYTSQTEIIVFKGENTKIDGYEGIYPVATRVLNDAAFSGGNFSSGDLEIENLALRPRSTGNASTWKKHGASHHLTLVLYQLSSLMGEAILESTEAEVSEQIDLLNYEPVD